jgi:hypothetical protein
MKDFVNLKTIAFRGRENKLLTMSRVFSHYLVGDVLDVGCDKKYIADIVDGNYLGIDIVDTADIRANLENGLPFRDRTFDTVLAFDVLEHLERLHYVFDDLCRISRSYVIIGLPNTYEWTFRVMFILGMNLGGKYGLPVESPEDRHRWLFSLTDAKNLVKQRSLRNGFKVNEEVIGYYIYRRTLPKMITWIGKLLAPLRSGLFARSYWVVLKRNNE